MVKEKIKSKNKILVIFLTIIALSSSLYSKIGESGIPSLMLDSYGARPMALADTFTGIANDINTISVNPAGLKSLTSLQCSVMYMKYPFDISFGNIAVGTPLSRVKDKGVIGGSITSFYLPGFEHYNRTGNKTDKELSANDFIFTLGYAMNLLKTKESLFAGMNIKLINSRLVDDTKNTLGMDLGVLFKMNVRSFSKDNTKNNLGLGISMQNIGSGVKYGSKNTSLPRNVRIGVGYNAYKEIQHNVIIGLDVNLPNDNHPIMSTGIEYSYIQILYLRLGYKLTNPELNNFACGCGVKFKIGDKKVYFDYALLLMKELDNKHVFSLLTKF